MTPAVSQVGGSLSLSGGWTDAPAFTGPAAPLAPDQLPRVSGARGL
jgi:hypothetical protein